MKQVLTKELVKKAMDDLKTGGKKITLTTLHAALDNRGSMSTLVQMKAELEAAAQLPNDSDEGLRAFREVWAMAKEEGRKQQNSVVADLQKDLEVLAQENERLEGAATAAANQADDARKARLELETELAKVKSQLAQNQESLIQAGTDTKAALERLAGEQAAHQITRLELAKIIQKAHEFELELVQCRTRLDHQSGRAKK
jgi:chromosome segregation ATPase